MFKAGEAAIKSTKKRKEIQDEFDKTMGIESSTTGQGVLGYLTNFKSTVFMDRTVNLEHAGMLCYFVSEEGNTFRATFKYRPYFYLAYRQGYDKEVRMFVDSKVKKYDSMEQVSKVDLQQMNHLAGKPKFYMKVSFRTVGDLMNARVPIKQMLDNRKTKEGANTGTDANFLSLYDNNMREVLDNGEYIIGLREFDVPYHSRICIDCGIRAGKWFQMDIKSGLIEKITVREDILSRPELKVLAFDIQTSKDPLKFPDAQKDVVMMISLMFDGMAYLIVNLGFCGQPVTSFSYTPKAEFACEVIVFNEQSEKALLEKFFKLIQTYKPSVITSFNGDKFDIPFIVTRCEKLGLNFETESGLYNETEGEYYGRFISHLDCYYWVDRDAYLPQGSHGLKAVTKAKLHYDPIEVNPEDMVGLAIESTQKLAEYSVSDAVATFFLYMKHIHDFIFALCTIIPMYPDEVLRKGSGTLCENLLMAQAFNRNIIFPNKKAEQFMKIVDGRRIDSETYTGGKVECLRTGVYRADFPTDFQLDPNAFQFLISNLDEVIAFTIRHESKNQTVDTCTNYQAVKERITAKLIELKDVKTPHRYMCKPLIYHLDVAAMYPNIILTNRLQPVAIVNQRICGNCIYVSEEGANCKRELQWEWKGEVFPLAESEFQQVQNRLDLEVRSKKDQKFCATPADYQKQLKKRVKLYCQKSYKKVHISRQEVRKDTVCMRQNSFYVDTVKAFRDRRYDFKAAVKSSKSKYEQFLKENNHSSAKNAKQLMALYESLQLAHKIILNSFYGYVMRKGARWYSMETAAMVTYIGSNIISDCKNFIEAKIGKPLELDTDGIWLLLPQGFPENQTLTFENGDKCHLSYPCAILNLFIYEKYLNNQYQTVNPQTNKYSTHTQMSIQFEIDGPYKAMFIPAAKQKQKTTELDTTLHNTQLLKKRYVVYNFKNQISEFKGFEMKRRGQLEIVKIFQSEIFEQYLKGSNLEECYEACAKVAKEKVNILLKKGENLTQLDLISFLEQSKVLSRDLQDYAEQKGVAVTAAKRLSEFLGSNCIRGKGICCYYIISEKPIGSPVTDRAIPTSIFEADEAVQRQFLNRWLGERLPEGEPIVLHSILDWNYYFERLCSTIQKMVCIPAVLQNLANPLPEVPLPEWLKKKTFDERTHKQLRINSFGLVPIKRVVQEQRKQTAADKVAKIVPKTVSRGVPKVNPYSLTTQFTSWLRVQTQFWRESTTDNKNQAFNHNWNILQLVPSRTPGAYTVWYFSGSRVQSTEVILDRHYYVLCKDPNKRSTRKAPRDQGVGEQIVMQQTKFQKEKQYYSSFLGVKTYETKLPLQTNFFINTGNMCRVRDRLKSYKQEQLQPVFGQQYLSNYQTQLPTVTILSVAYLDNMVWAVEYATQLDRQYRFVFTKHAFTGLEKAREKDVYYKIVRNTLKTAGLKIEIEGFSNLHDTLSYINEYLSEKRLHLRQAFLVVTRSEYQSKQLQELGLKELYTELPVVSLPRVEIHDVSSLSSLSWRDRLLRLALEQLLATPEHLQKVVSQARYSHLPICNAPVTQKMDTITNIMYSRVLRAGDNLLWWDEFNNSTDSFYESQIYTGRVNNSGLYTSYCVQFDIANLPLNAILSSDELMGQPSIANNSTKKTRQHDTLDQMSSVYTAFEYLRKMVRAFIEDIDNKSEQADLLVQNLYKWLITRSNSLYDPLLHRLIKQLTKTMFYTFMLKVKAMGFKIVFANFERLIISTENNTHQQAVSRTKFMLTKCLQDEKKKYRYLILTPVKVWKLILWKDTHNFAGFTETEPGDIQYQSNWEITKNLAPAIARVLPGPIFVYLQMLCHIKDTIVSQETDHRELFMVLGKRFAEKVCEYIEGEFTQRIIEGVQSLFAGWSEYISNGSKGLEGETQIIPEEDESEEQQEEEQEEQEEDDSFVVDDDAFDIEGELQQHQRKKRKGTKRVKKAQEQEQKEQWGDKHNLQLFIENLFAIIASEDSEIQDRLQALRSKALRAIEFEPFIRYRVIQPVYPLFEIPCERCFRINEAPGICACNSQLTNVSPIIENTVWQMINQIGTDLWCSHCKSNRVDYLKHCPCGGKWILGEDPLRWIEYVDRNGQDWQFVDRVVEFMGLTEQPAGS